MIKWLLKKSIWATEAKKWHGMSHNDESDVFHTFSSTCSTWLGPHLFLGIFILFSGAFGRLTICSRRHKVKELKYYIILLCHGDTQRELVNTLWTHHVLHLFLVEWGTLLMCDLVHLGTLWLCWSMYCMLSSSQPLIRIFYLLILATRFESG